MKSELFKQVEPARLLLAATVALGLLVAVATVAQMVLLSGIVAGVLSKARTWRG